MQVEETADAVHIHVGGAIDERARFETPVTGGRPVILDCADVARLNSRGVATWCKFVAELSRLGPVTIRRLSPIMVAAANMIETFLGAAQVESFQSPWVCPVCSHQLLLLHTRGDSLPEYVRCPTCRSAMAFERDRQTYLAFLE